jgi:hypothetical protein
MALWFFAIFAAWMRFLAFLGKNTQLTLGGVVAFLFFAAILAFGFARSSWWLRARRAR